MKIKSIIFILSIWLGVSNVSATECGDIKTIKIGANGPGYSLVPTDSATPGLPDFVAKKIELSNYNPKIYESIEAKATFKNDGVEDIDSDDKIESRFYLSQGYKEDSHSEWIRIGKEKSKGSSLDPV